MRSWMRSAAGGVVIALIPAAIAAQRSPLGTPIPEKPLGTALESDAGPTAFLENQLRFGRVAAARDASDDSLRALFREKGVSYPAPEIFLRVFKHERVLELWARADPDSAFTLIKDYPVCALPGQLGPKQALGDFQVPEGFYFIDEFNPRSNYHLSLRVSYPNLADRMRRDGSFLGGDIYIHGGCETVGCVPIENHNIQEVYWIAAQAMDAGQRVIPVHIFPSRMDPATMRWLESTFDPDPRLLDFWRNLAEGHAYFEDTRQVPWITVAPDGRYTVPPVPRLADGEPTPAAAPADTLARSVPGDTLVRPGPGDTLVAPAAADSIALPAADTAATDSTGSGRGTGGSRIR